MTAYARINVTGNAKTELQKIAASVTAVNKAAADGAVSMTKLEKAAGAGGMAKGAKGAGELAANAVKVDIAARKGATGTKALGDAAAKATPAITRVVASTTSYARATGQVGNASKAATTEIKRATTEANNYARAADKAANAAVKLAGANRRVSNPFGAGTGGSFRVAARTNGIDSMLGRLGTFGANGMQVAGGALSGFRMMATFAAPIMMGMGGALAMAVREASALDTAMSRVRAASMASRQEMTMLSEQASRLGASTQFSAAEVGRVQENYAKAGFSIQETLSAVPSALALAGATDTDTGFASGLISQVIRSIGFEATDSGMISDNLVTAANVSNVDVADLAETMKYAAPVFANMGRDQQTTAFRDLSALSGILGDQGIRGSMAGTGLRTGYLAMAAPTARARRAMEGLNVDPNDADGNVRRMPEILGDLRTALEGKTSSEQSRALRDIFGAEGAGTFAAILSADSSRFDELVNAMEGSAGAAERTARIMQDNLGGDIEKLGGSMGGLGTTIGTQMLPSVRHSVQSIGDFVDAMNGAITASDRGKGIFQGMGQTLAGAVDGFRTALERLMPGLLGLLESLGMVEPGTAAEFAGQMAEANADARVGRIQAQAMGARDQINMNATRTEQSLTGIRGKVGDAEGSTGTALAADVRRRLRGAGLEDLANSPEVSQALGTLQGNNGRISAGARRQALRQIQTAMTPEVERRLSENSTTRDTQLAEVDRVEGRSVSQIESTREAARQEARTHAQTIANGNPVGAIGGVFRDLGNLDEVRGAPQGAQERTGELAARQIEALARATEAQTRVLEGIRTNTAPTAGGDLTPQ